MTLVFVIATTSNLASLPSNPTPFLNELNLTCTVAHIVYHNASPHSKKC